MLIQIFRVVFDNIIKYFISLENDVIVMDRYVKPLFQEHQADSEHGNSVALTFCNLPFLCS